jgi:hypothetical protein
MRRRVRYVVAMTAVALLLGGSSTFGTVELALQTPPVLAKGRWHVPVREMCEWMGASVAWNSRPAGVTVTYRGRSHSWDAASGGLLIRRGRSFLPARTFLVTLGFRVEYRGDLRAFEFGDDEVGDILPVGWRLPRVPRGLSQDGREVWRLLVRPGHPWAITGLISQPANLRIAGRWAAADLHALNAAADDPVKALLEKRDGEWRITALGPGLGADRNYGIPERVRRRLGLWG